MNSQLITPPAYLAVSLAKVKTFLRVDSSAEDDLITNQIKAATRRLEALADCKFVTQTWAIYYDNFPLKYKDQWWDGVRDGAISNMSSCNNHLVLPFGPLQSLTSFSTYADDDVEQVFSSASYMADTVTRNTPKVSLKTGYVWPTTILRPTSGIKLVGVFGFGQGYIPAADPLPAVESTIPEDIQEAIKQLTANMYEHRGDELPKIPDSVAMLIEPYRKFKV